MYNNRFVRVQSAPISDHTLCLKWFFLLNPLREFSPLFSTLDPHNMMGFSTFMPVLREQLTFILLEGNV